LPLAGISLLKRDTTLASRRDLAVSFFGFPQKTSFFYEAKKIALFGVSVRTPEITLGGRYPLRFLSLERERRPDFPLLEKIQKRLPELLRFYFYYIKNILRKQDFYF